MKKSRPAVMKAAAVVGVAALGLGACGSSKSSNTGSSATTASGGGGSSTSAVKIGFFGALSGANAALGINILNGEKLAISQYMAGHPKVAVTVDSFDSQGDPSQANNGAQKLIGDKVVAVVGPAFSGESKAANPYFAQAGIPHITASATNVALAQSGDKFFYRGLADDSAQGPGDANYLVKTLGAKTIAVIDDKSSYGQGLADYVRSQIKTDGATDVVDDHVDPNGQDYSSTVNKIVAAKPAAVFYGGYYDAAGRLIKQLKDKGYTGAFMSGDGSEDPHFITDAGATAAEGAYLSCACEDTSAAPSAATFNTAYQAAYGTPPAIYSGEGYDVTNFLLAAIKAGNTTPSAINNYLKTNSWTGITKTLKFQSDGDLVGGTVYVYQVKNGKITQIGTTPS
ncbi:branched-chain amino acid ABC transporter substrate-binding protein [Acidiferrimicrobium sp. IK]|uniref:branched-chain amino acid ABC transporter substrate-binding protein n=1 Tax=Acidiferrimicrobium sp. IK TaxID=2871700 RepID=UPI0021CB6A99|nr:branched-chain amino acid ABC transporter substrate-binding protein [Acidiferrimicrobium sp. IK]MCU4183671.1 branched-chain amino acid ABC transporter substrate-binding protein [Acidiferrimicrobium sp. IK]